MDLYLISEAGQVSPLQVTNFPAISGGLPTRPDLAPSIVFIVAYFLLLFPTIWRAYTYRRPRMLLFTFIRLVLFLVIRIATFALRADEAVTAELPFNPLPSLNIFIAEQILLGVGFIVMLDLMVVFLQSHISRTDVPLEDETEFAQANRAPILRYFITILHASLIAAIAMGIVAGAMYSSAVSNPSKNDTVKALRIASTSIALIVVGFIVIISLLLLIRFPHLGVQRTLYLFITGGLLLVIPAFRLSTSVATHTSLTDLISTATRVKFYILQAMVEWIVAALLVLVDVRVWFFAGGQEAKMMLDGTHPKEWRQRVKTDSPSAEVEAKFNPV
ncbi:hypothetical protein DACRYDRAFT_20972 [Dacryopinax primogenitus]|uniref:Uncharacterized protein n=1 Tax=Dacryopinax primogenitus (strain DJM 731) TaxID=1858805 RepID=M5GFU7_DACPD|nr:uncharacterized protein DACRYDRAFT_20972 [Dacryopinax primogenitus]EJU04448.1 hypothetical protein DACRYDRAFT_20972 [Dacryopinax primogenitus]